MLFTRNHEKEVEIEALKDAYEYEIDCIIKDARKRLENVEKRIRDLERELSNGSSQNRSQLQEALTRKDEEWIAKVKGLEQTLQSEKKESQNSRDLLIKARNDIEKLRTAHSGEISKISRDTGDKSKEIDRLKDIIRNLEYSISEKQQKLSSANDLNKHIDALQKEIHKLKEQYKNSEKVREHVIVKNKQLEGEIKNLRKALNKKSAQSDKVSNSSHQSKPDKDYTTNTSVSVTTSHFLFSLIRFEFEFYISNHRIRYVHKYGAKKVKPKI